MTYEKLYILSLNPGNEQMEMIYGDKLFLQLSSPNCLVREAKVSLQLHLGKGFFMRYYAVQSFLWRTLNAKEILK